MNVLVSGGAGYIGAHVVRLLLAIFPKVAHIARLMRTAGIPHVHCHFASHPALAGFLIHRLTGIPFSFTAHGSDLHVDRHMLCPKVAEAAFVVAISEDNRAEIARECGERSSGKVMVIHCGVDTEALRPRDGRPAEGPFRILCIGTLHEVKGQAYLVEACRLLAEEGLDLTCRLVGDGPDRAALARRVAESGLQRQVVFTGWRTRGEVAELLHGADALVAPSVATRGGKREGIPVVLMEAMSSGVPVVASRLSGIPELVEDGRTGLLVPPRDAAALAAALKRLRDDPGLRGRLGEAAREKVIREFDVRRNAALLARDFRGGAAT